MGLGSQKLIYGAVSKANTSLRAHSIASPTSMGAPRATRENTLHTNGKISNYVQIMKLFWRINTFWNLWSCRVSPRKMILRTCRGKTMWCIDSGELRGTELVNISPKLFQTCKQWNYRQFPFPEESIKTSRISGLHDVIDFTRCN